VLFGKGEREKGDWEYQEGGELVQIPLYTHMELQMKRPHIINVFN
jgi:hypothetical protein